MYIDGAGLRRTGRQLGIYHQTVANWAKEQAEQLPQAPMPAEVKAAEFDEIFTYIGDKKNRIYLITLVDRETRCFLGWKVAWERSQELMQAIVDHAPKAHWYYSDAFDVYASLWYHWVVMQFRKAKPTPIQSKAMESGTLVCLAAKLSPHSGSL